MELEFELAGSQIDGARDYQEDAFLITHLIDAKGMPSVLVVVADGMGGHAAGNVASNMAVQAFNKYVSENYPTDDLENIMELAIIKANHSIKETIVETPALAGMGCTMVAAVLENGNIIWASVGDSHCYLLRNGELKKLNADHSYGGFLDRMEAQGKQVVPEAGLSRNMLMSAITGDDINEIDIPREPVKLQANDRVLLCSDGMDTLDVDDLIDFSSKCLKSPKEYADKLMEAVKKANTPNQDNTTAVVVDVSEEIDDKTPTPASGPELANNMGLDNQNTVDTVNMGNAQQPVIPLQPPETTDTLSENKSISSFTAVVIFLLLIGAGGFLYLNPELLESFMERKPADRPIVTIVDEETEELPIESGTAEEVVAKPEETAAADPLPIQKPVETRTVSTGGKIIQDRLKSGGKGPVMVVIPPGRFEMGNASVNYPDEYPKRDVVVKKFAVSQYEITFEQYDRFAKATGRKRPDSQGLDRKDHPVIFVRWEDAYYYARWLSEETGKEYSLASEAQWEYMASGGRKTPFWWGYDAEPNRAHCFGCKTGFDPRRPTRIGNFKPNVFGVYDTAGNVAEWVSDCWHKNYQGAPRYAEVWEGGDCMYRVVRGGSYSTPFQSIRSAKRDKFKSDRSYDHIGIRVVRKVR